MNGWRKGVAALVALLAVALISGCTVPEPPGAAPLRYRDQVFNNVTVTSNLQYGSAPDAQGNPVPLMLDMYRPTGDTQTSRPALVWVHGGSFTGGDKTNLVPVDVANTFAKLGYVVVSINYRLLGSNCIANPSRLHRGGDRGQARRPGGGALAPCQRRHLRHRSHAHRHRRRVGRRHHGDAGGPPLRGCGHQRQPRLAVDRGRVRVGLRRRADRRRPCQLRRRPRPVLPRHGRQHRATPRGRWTPRPRW